MPVEFETIDLTKHTLKDEGAFNMAITSLKRNGVGLKGRKFVVLYAWNVQSNSFP